MKDYEVKIEFSYLLKAENETEAIRQAMDRYRGRKFTGVYFNGMTINTAKTNQKIPIFCDHKLNQAELPIKETPKLTPEEHWQQFQDFGKEEGDPHYGQTPRAGKDSKEQEYMDFGAADAL